MARPHQRVAALILAVLLFATSIATGAAVLWQMRQDSNNGDTTATNSTNQNANADQPNNQGGDMLQGTQLEDFTPAGNVPKLQSQDLKEGTGEVVQPGATVTAHYTGAIVSTGRIFQSSHDRGQPLEFSLDGVIRGWTEGVPGMRVGGIRRLTIPAEKAYGAQSPSPDIPPNSDLVFDIEITAVKN